MRAGFLSLILMLAFGAFFGIQAQTATRASVGIGKEKKVARTKLKIKFVKLVEDSRCPTDTNCVWAGSAKIQIKVTGKRGASKTFEINTGIATQTATFEGYEIKFMDLTPKPATNIRINPDGYTASFEVKKM